MTSKNPAAADLERSSQQWLAWLARETARRQDRPVKPLYEELVKTPEGKARARAIYDKARPGYHPMAAGAVDAIFAKMAK